MAEGEQSGAAKFGATVKKYAKRVWEYLKVAKMEYIVMIALFALDLISKAIVNATTAHGEVVVLIPNFLNIHNSHNYNAAFGNSWLSDWLGNLGSRIFFSIFAVAASVVFIIILVKNKGGNKLLRVSLAMLVAGAMGNCIDRMFLNYVRDFIEFVYFGLTIAGRKSFYIFNIADSELVIGVILVLVYYLFLYRDDERKRKKKETAGEAIYDDATALDDDPTLDEQNVTDPDTETAATADTPDTEQTESAEQTEPVATDAPTSSEPPEPATDADSSADKPTENIEASDAAVPDIPTAESTAPAAKPKTPRKRKNTEQEE